MHVSLCFWRVSVSARVSAALCLHRLVPASKAVTNTELKGHNNPMRSSTYVAFRCSGSSCSHCVFSCHELLSVLHMHNVVVAAMWCPWSRHVCLECVKLVAPCVFGMCKAAASSRGGAESLEYGQGHPQELLEVLQRLCTAQQEGRMQACNCAMHG